MSWLKQADVIIIIIYEIQHFSKYINIAILRDSITPQLKGYLKSAAYLKLREAVSNIRDLYIY